MGKRLSKIYTRTGDQGETGLADGKRVAKDDLRIEAIGTVDELNSQIGLAIELMREENAAYDAAATFLRECQHRLFDLGGELSIPGFRIVEARHVEAIETRLDELNADLAPLEDFILPGGSPAIASLHVARSLCRRAERRLVSLNREERVNEDGLKFLNRLSDYLFVAARHCALVGDVDEVLWQKS